MSVVRLCTPDAGSDPAISRCCFVSVMPGGVQLIMVVSSLVPAVFGPQLDTERGEAEYERQGRIRFIKLLLEG